MEMFKRLLASISALVLLLSLAACAQGAGVSPACSGYAAGREGELAYNWHGEEQFILPVEFVRCFAVYAAEDLGEATAARVIYDYDAAYMADLVKRRGDDPEALRLQMNNVAARNGLGFSFGSVTGSADTEKKLWEKFGVGSAPFEESTGCLADLKRAAELFLADETLSGLLGSARYTFEGGSSKTRTAPLLAAGGQFKMDNALLFLGGNAVKNGAAAYAAIAAVIEDGTVSYAAVLAQSGSDDPTFYAAVDAGNLCGRVLGKNYNMNYLPSSPTSPAGMTVGSTIFKIVVLIFVCAAAFLLLLVIIVGIVTRVKRNSEGRKRYAAPKTDASSPEDGKNE